METIQKISSPIFFNLGLRQNYRVLLSFIMSVILFAPCTMYVHCVYTNIDESLSVLLAPRIVHDVYTV